MKCLHPSPFIPPFFFSAARYTVEFFVKSRER